MWIRTTWHVANLKWCPIGTIRIGSGATTTVICISFRQHSGSGAGVYVALMVYSGPQNLDSVISYTWDIKRGGPSGTNAQEVSAFI